MRKQNAIQSVFEKHNAAQVQKLQGFAGLIQDALAVAIPRLACQLGSAIAPVLHEGETQQSSDMHRR